MTPELKTTLHREQDSADRVRRMLVRASVALLAVWVVLLMLRLYIRAYAEAPGALAVATLLVVAFLTWFCFEDYTAGGIKAPRAWYWAACSFNFFLVLMVIPWPWAK